jgi:methionine synthase I (cobalamin-dependent)/5,10-methylenetetrahydrofolate reductase
MPDFLSAIEDRVLVCDGAMGTMLYTKGIFISRCFDELNLSAPALVREVHADYVKAGADIVETNTFGANRTKLMTHGLAEQTREINLQGARLAREAARANAFVAGAIGPLGIRIEPWGKTSIEEARAVFRDQAQALVDGGVDLFILETFFDLNEVQAAMRGVRDVSDRPLVVQMSVEDDGNSQEGTPPELFAKRLDEWGADVVGLNCSVGPQAMLDAIERIANATSKKLSAQPNAGKPRSIEGRNIYLCSPEYMASYARRLVEHGVRIVGGCCGTTPEHIQAIRKAVQGHGLHGLRGSKFVQSMQSAARSESPTLANKSRFGGKLAREEFIKIVEMIPPVGHDYAEAIDKAKYLQAHHIDAINVLDAPPSSARMNAISLAILLERSTEIESLAHYTCRDKNLLGMQADLLGAYALGLRNLLLTTGDPHQVGDYMDATAVFDVDSIGLTNMVRSLNQGIDVGEKSIGKPTGFVLGVGANAGTISNDAEELNRFKYKVQAGAEFALTQPVFDVRAFEGFVRRIESCKVPVVVGILPLPNFKMAEFMHYEVPGCSLPPHILQRMQQADSQGPDRARAEGIAIAREILNAVRGMVQGVQIRGPFDRYETPLEVLS